jgi:hypothetical protein
MGDVEMTQLFKTNKRSYLECFDSVRVPVDSNGKRPESLDTEILQAGLAVLAELIEGHPVSIPHSYAFDSACFNQVALMVLKARNTAFGQAGKPCTECRPFIAPKYQKTSFNDFVVDRAKSAANKKFVTSLWGGLGVDKLQAVSTAEKFESLTDDWRTEGFRMIRQEFSSSNNNLMCKPKEEGLALPKLAGSFVRHVAKYNPMKTESSTCNKLLSAIDKLGGETELCSALSRGGRSVFRSTNNWPNKKKLVSDILSFDELSLMIEAVDTLYNLVLADSTRVPLKHQKYFTALNPSLQDILSQAIAQDIALDSLPGRNADVSAIFCGAGRQDTGKALALLRGGFENLFADLAEPKGKVLASLQELNNARPAGQNACNEAQKKHIDVVSSVLSGKKEFKISLKEQLPKGRDFVKGIAVKATASALLGAVGYPLDVPAIALNIGVVTAIGWTAVPCLETAIDIISKNRKKKTFKKTFAAMEVFLPN